jgi:hypothetical protein
MSEGEALYLFLVLLYVFESAFWLRRGGLAFVSGFGRRPRPVPPDRVVSNRQGGIVFGALLPPLAPVFVARSPEVSLSPDGLFSYVSTCPYGRTRRDQDAVFFPVEAADEIAVEDRGVSVNGRPFLTAVGSAEAAAVFADIVAVQNTPPAARGAAIDSALDRTLDANAARTRHEEVRGALPDLRLFQNLLFVYIFVGAPLLAWFYPLALIWLRGLIVLAVLHFGTLFLLWRAHRRLYPAARAERWRHLAVLFLFPPASLRAADLVSRPALTGFHPVAVAAAIGREEDLRDVAGRVLRDAHWPLRPVVPTDDPRARETEKWFRARFAAAVERRVRAEGIDPDELTGPGPRLDAAARAWCPRCLTEYARAEGDCSDCGVGLRGFAEAD